MRPHVLLALQLQPQSSASWLVPLVPITGRVVGAAMFEYFTRLPALGMHNVNTATQRGLVCTALSILCSTTLALYVLSC